VAERRHPGGQADRAQRRHLAYVSGFVIPKNAPNKAGAYAYLDAMLEKGAQENFRDRHGLQPDRDQRRRRAGPHEAHRLHARTRSRRSSTSTTPTSNKNDAAMKEWWDKVFKA
jgi:putative spermidine/putrescine transport system substrate-binding protein